MSVEEVLAKPPGWIAEWVAYFQLKAEDDKPRAKPKPRRGSKGKPSKP